MPSVRYTKHVMMISALSVLALTSGCGKDNGAGNSAEIQMKDIETVDGTISDAMTDLDGVQAASTVVADTGTGNTATPARPAADAQNAASPQESIPAEDTEVVADQ